MFNARSTFQSLCGTLLKTVDSERKNGLMHPLVFQSRVDQVFVRQTLPLQLCSRHEHSHHSDVAVTQTAAGAKTSQDLMFVDGRKRLRFVAMFFLFLFAVLFDSWL